MWSHFFRENLQNCPLPFPLLHLDHLLWFSSLWNCLSEDNMPEIFWNRTGEMTQTSTEKGVLEWTYHYLPTQLRSLSGPWKDLRDGTITSLWEALVRKEGSEPDLREQLDGWIWQLLAAEEWETLLVKWVLWISEGIARPGVVEAKHWH